MGTGSAYYFITPSQEKAVLVNFSVALFMISS